MSDPIREWLARFVGSPAFLSRYPLYAHILARLDPILDPSVAVIAVSAHGSRFYLHVNVDYFMANARFLRGLLLHEVHHVVLGHLSDRRIRSAAYPWLMELAMEMSANEGIVEDLPGMPVTWERFQREGIRAGQSTLERYEILVRETRAGSVFRLVDGDRVDDHVPAGVGGILRAGGVPGADGDVPGADGDDVIRLVRSARAAVEATDPGGLTARIAGRDPGRLLQELTGVGEKPARPLDWRAELRMFVESRRAPTPTWARPPRRFPRLLGIAPGRIWRPTERDNPRLIVAVDTSGSMGPADLAEVARQLEALARHARITIVECDAAIQRVYPFRDRIDSFAGRGGTDLRPVFEPGFLVPQRPGGVVYFTDGCGPWPAEPPPVKTLWVLTAPGPFECPWGRIVRMPRSDPTLRRPPPARARSPRFP